jgi:hypothetical protein
MQEGITKSVTSSVELPWKVAASLPFRSEHCLVCRAMLQRQCSHMTTEHYFLSTLKCALFVCYNQHVSLEGVSEKEGESWGIRHLSWSWQPCWMLTARNQKSINMKTRPKMGVFQEKRVAASFCVLSFCYLLWYVLKVTLVLSCVL